MKTLVYLCFGLFILSSCNNDDESNTQTSEIIGDWKLIEVYIDPGDGSGTFQAVESDKTITFFNDGTVTSTGDLCSMFVAGGNASSGTYSEVDSVITPNDCQESIPNWNYSFVIEGNSLMLYYPCIEACVEKYSKQ
ncbi:lipocalin family protein [Winogradskyella schleiferi]|uniref:lipocalin family protein n=1 Tax=Winogradskyella schleiferi TaxID=2686078 RepID=UPI0015C02502|nr:lipocalin family protein [Winogradskyella schleiferi]